MTKKKAMTKKAEKEMLQQMDEITEIAEAEVKKTRKKKEEKNKDFPAITLPARGYFRELDFGTNVENLQAALNHVIDANIPVTGLYDEDTVNAVKKYEAKFGGFPNGRFGHEEFLAYNKMRGVK